MRYQLAVLAEDEFEARLRPCSAETVL